MTTLHHLPGRRQQGGTVAGLLIGLIVGLIVAVVVAMTVMKSPLPFVDKIGRQTPATGELGDPNKALSGRAPERRSPPPADTSAGHEAESDGPALPAGPPVDEPVAPQKPASVAKPAPASPSTSTPASPAPRTDLPAAKAPVRAGSAPAANSAANPASPAASANVSGVTGADGFTYYLQAGAFREQQDAEATKARLALLGVAASIAERKSDLGILYRVRVGPFADVESMNRARSRLTDNGVDVAVVRVPK